MRGGATKNGRVIIPSGSCRLPPKHMTHLFLGKSYLEIMITIPAELKDLVYVNYIRGTKKFIGVFNSIIISVYVGLIDCRLYNN